MLTVRLHPHRVNFTPPRVCFVHSPPFVFSRLSSMFVGRRRTLGKYSPKNRTHYRPDLLGWDRGAKLLICVYLSCVILPASADIFRLQSTWLARRVCIAWVRVVTRSCWRRRCLTPWKRDHLWGGWPLRSRHRPVGGEHADLEGTQSVRLHLMAGRNTASR